MEVPNQYTLFVDMRTGFWRLWCQHVSTGEFLTIYKTDHENNMCEYDGIILHSALRKNVFLSFDRHQFILIEFQHFGFAN
jgi:hypothetical protein